MFALITYKNPMLYVKNTLAVASFILLSACANKPMPAATQAPEKKAVAPSQKEEAKTPKKSLTKQAVTEKQISRQTLEGLMLAEIAGQRRLYDYALNAYLTQAQKTKDSRIAERTLDIAEFINAQAAQKKALDIWLTASPKDTKALARAAEFNMHNGNVIKTFGYMQKLEKLEANTPYHYLAIFSKGLDKEKTQQLLKKIKAQKSKKTYNQVNLLYAQGLLLQQLHQDKKAMKYYEKALKKGPERKDIGLQKTRLLLMQNKPQKALDWINELHTKHPEDKSTAVLRARLLIRTNRQADALNAFDALYKRHPFDADILLSLALLELDMGHEKQAENHLQILINQHQKLNQAHYYIGRLYFSKNLYSKALNHFKQIKEQGREYLPAQAHIVNILYSQKGINIALEHLHKVQTSNPKAKADLLMLEAEILIREKQLNKAMAVYNRGVSTYPKNEEMLYSRAILAIQKNNIALAEQDLKRILNMHPNNARALNTLGYTLLISTERLDEAKELITKAHKINPQSAAILDSLGWLYFKMGDLEEAKSLLEEAFAKNQDQEIAAHLGEVLWLKGNQDAARQVWKKGLDSNTEGKAIKKTMERLNVK